MLIDMPRRKLSLSLTPLIDVVFILLVFFMLASSFMQWRSLELNVPGESAGAASEQQPLWVRIAAEGAVSLGDQALPLETLPIELRRHFADDPQRAVSLQPEGDVPLQRIVEVLDALNAAGARNVTLLEDE